MAFTEDYWLPTFEELTVEEVPLSGPALKAGATLLGVACKFENNEFMLCKNELRDPRRCLNEGKAVTACTLKFFRSIKKHCYHEFERYAYCLDKSSSALRFEPCRKTQKALDECVGTNLGIERPEFDYFTLPKIHESERPKPPEELMIFEGTPKAPEDGLPEPLPPKYGIRFWFLR